MTSTVGGGLSRVTIVAPHRRMHLAIPSDVPLADMVPTLLRYTGDHLLDEGALQGGWILTRLGGVPLDGRRTATEQGIMDGDLLQFRPRAATPPPPQFDDLVDAVATATVNRPGRWQPADTRRFAVAVSAAALIGGAVAALFVGASHMVAGVVSLIVGLVLLVAAALASRAGGEGRAAALLGVVCLAYGGVGGLLLGGDVPLSKIGPSNVLLAGAVLVVFAAVATVSIGAAKPVFVSASIAAAALALGAIASMTLGATAAGAAAVIGTVAFGTIPMMPMLAYRFAGMRVPSIPSGPDDVRSDRETVNGPDVLSRSDRAAEFLTGMLGTAAVTVGGAMIVVAFGGGLPGAILCTVLALCLLLRARPLLGRAQRLTVLIPGALGLGIAAATAFVAVPPLVRLTGVLGGLALVAVASLVYGFAVAGKRISPIWPRTLDILEVVLIVSVVPLALWVSGVFHVIGSLVS